MPSRPGKYWFRQVKLFFGFLKTASWATIFLFLLIPLFLVLTSTSFLLSSPISTNSLSDIPSPTPPSGVIGTLSVPAPLPISKNLQPPAISAAQVFVLDRTSKVVLFQKNASVQVYPASTTKMLSALIVLDTYPLDKLLTVSVPYPTGQNISLVPQETLSVDQLLYALLIHSANDAAEVLAENFPGGRPAFVAAMNTKAAALHLNNSHFLNPTGWDEAGHNSTALDLARLADFALTYPHFAKIVAVENSVITSQNHPKAHILSNVNQLLGKLPGVIGVKTGQTDLAGQVLVTLVNRQSHPVILVVLGSADRFGDTTKLVEWVYTNFTWESVRPGQDSLGQ